MSRSPFGAGFWMPNRCWLMSLVAEAILLLPGMKEDLRVFLLVPLLLLAAAWPFPAASSRLSMDDLRFSKRVLGLAAAAAIAAEAAPCWNRVLRCFGTGVSFKLTRLPRSDVSNDVWNCLYSSSIGLMPKLRRPVSPEALFFTWPLPSTCKNNTQTRMAVQYRTCPVYWWKMFLKQLVVEVLLLPPSNMTLVRAAACLA